jgi:ATP-dependent RNA helicase SUPV3L1/SUV3
MYQAGEVEHLVATDAIGMGLNMDVAHVAFAQLAKFDGMEQRRLRVPEMAQIAGRAGRHMANGSFGGTSGCEPFEPREIEAIESHAFTPLKSLRWRNSELDFAGVEALAASLDRAPRLDCLVKVRDAVDHRSLIFLSRRDEVRAAATSEERVRLLWQVCQIPDFRKTLTEAHLHLLATVFRHLTGRPGILPNDWVGNMIAQLERFDGDIDALVTRIAHIRTWTYMSHRGAWLDDARHWQERARAVEDRLSDALHERLTQRFVDRRTSALMRSLRERDEHAAVVDADGEIAVDGHLVGRITGLSLAIVDPGPEADRRLLTAAARRAALPVLRRRAGELAAAGDDAIALAEDDSLTWRATVVARLRPGAAVLAPLLRLEVDPTLDAALREAVRRRLERWLDRWIDARLGALARLREAAAGDVLSGAGRGVAYRMVEAYGAMARAASDSLIRDLAVADRRALGRLGVRFGRHHLYLADLLKPAAAEARTRLWRIFHGRPQSPPPPGRTVLRRPFPVQGEAMLPMGFAVFDGFAVRVDILERIAAQLRARARGGAVFSLPPTLAAEAGLTRGELALLVEALGFRAQTGTEGTLIYGKPESRRRRDQTAKRPGGASAAASPFAALAALRLAPRA